MTMPIDNTGITRTVSSDSDVSGISYDGLETLTQENIVVYEYESRSPTDVLVQMHDGKIVSLAVFLAERTGANVLLFEMPTRPTRNGLHGEMPASPTDEHAPESDAPMIVQHPARPE